MGVRLVGEALRQDWCVLSDRARLVLLQMCYVARDRATADTAAQVYFGGHKELMKTVLGLDPDRLTGTQLDTAERAVKRAIKELKDAGAITLLSHPVKGQRAVYQVHPGHYPNLQQETLPVDNSPATPTVGGHQRPPLGGHPAPPYSAFRGTPSTPLRGAPSVPPNYLDKNQEQGDLKGNHPTQPPTELWAAPVPDLWITR